MSLPLPDRQTFDPENDSVPSDLTERVGEGEVVVLAAEPGSEPWSRATAIALARAWTPGIRLLLVDLELDSPGLHETLDVENGEGASDHVLFGSSIRRVARPVDGGGFYLVPAGTPSADPEAVLGHPRWERLARAVRDAQATLLLYVRTDLPGSASVLDGADRIVVLRGGDGAGPDRLPGTGDAVIGVLEAPEEQGAPSGASRVTREGTGSAPPADEIVDISDLAPDVPPGAGPEARPGAGSPGAAPSVEPSAEEPDEIVDIAALAPDPPPDDRPGDADRLGPEEQVAGDEAPAGAGPDAAAGTGLAPGGSEVVDIAELAPDPPADEPFSSGTEDVEAGPGAVAADPAGGEEIVDIEDLAPGAPVTAGPAGADDLPDRPDEEGASTTPGLVSGGEPVEPDVEETAGADDAAEEEEVPDFGADLVTGPDFGAGAPDADAKEPPVPRTGAPGAAPGSAGPGEAPSREEPEGAGDGGAPEEPESPPVEPARRPERPEEGEVSEGAAGPGEEARPAAGDARREDPSEAERLERLERRLREHRSPRRRGPVMLLLALFLLAAGAAVAAHWYGFVRVPGLDGALTALFGPARTGPAPTLVTEGSPPASPLLEYSLVVDEYREAGAAREVATALTQRLPDHLFVVAPVQAGSEIAYRLLAGPATDRGEAEDLRPSLAGILSREDPGEWEVRPTPVAFLLDELETGEAARLRAEELSERGVPAYALRVAYPERGDRFRVYAGAYADEEEARAMQGLLAREGIDDAALTRRRGAVPE